MSWLHAPGLVECPSGSPSLIPDTEWPVTWRGKDTPPKRSQGAWTMGASRSPLSIQTSAPSMVEACAESHLSSLRAACLASRTVSPGSSADTMTLEPSGLISFGSSESQNQGSSLSKTCLDSENTLPLFGMDFESWVSSGLHRSYRPPVSPVRHISESDSLPLLPTPSASSCGTNQGGSAGRKGPARPGLETLVRQIPTPTCRDWKDGACQDANVPTNSLLGRYVTRLPTVADAMASGAAGYSTESGRHSGTTLTDAVCGAASTGRSGILNPRLSEWLQGMPIGWTSSAPLETSDVRQWFTRARSSLLRDISTNSEGDAL